MINETELPGAIESGLTYYQVENLIHATTYHLNIFFQLWGGSESDGLPYTLNEGPQGLPRLDYVVASAAKHDIRLILTFTNNWCVYYTKIYTT